MRTLNLSRTAFYAVAGMLTSAISVHALPLVIPTGGAQALIGGCVLVSVNGIFFSGNTAQCTTPNVFNAGNPDTGSYNGLTGGTLQNLLGTPVVGNLATPIVDFTTFNTSSGLVHFDLVSLDPGFGTAAGCASNAVGSQCTPPGSPITLTQIAPNSVAITLGLNGQAYLGSSSTGTSPTGALFTTQNVIPGTITGILARVTSPQGFQDSYSAIYTSVTAPGTCPANAIQSLLGRWTFSTEGFVPTVQPFESAGVFAATVGTNKAGNPIGILTITNTASRNGNITRQETDAGLFTVLPDCSGGTLVFNLSANPMAFDFFFAKGGTELFFVSTNGGDTVVGKARLAPVAGCPVNPLQALAGRYTFSSDGYVSGLPFGSAGTFTASVGSNTAGTPQGVLSILDTANLSGQDTRLETATGRYQISPDCSGGSLSFDGANHMQFDFFFVNGGSDLVFIGTDNGNTVSGKATRM